jgi:hypothetical protein
MQGPPDIKEFPVHEIIQRWRAAQPCGRGLRLETLPNPRQTLGLIACGFQPERAVSSLEVTRHDPDPGAPTSFGQVAMWLD